MAPPPSPVDVGIVAAMSMEVGFLRDRLTKVRKYAGPRHSVVEGECGGKVVALIVAGLGRQAAHRGAQVLIEGHRPRWILSAGFAGALDPGLNRNDIVLPSEIVDPEGGRFVVNVGVSTEGRGPRARSGRLLTVDHIARTIGERTELRRRFEADAVDMESSAVASYCGERSIPFFSIRIVSDDARHDLPPEIATLMTRSGSYNVGAALRALWHRPAILKDFWSLYEHGQEAADRLAAFTVGFIQNLPSHPLTKD